MNVHMSGVAAPEDGMNGADLRVNGRVVRRVTVAVTSGLRIHVLQADADETLDAAVSGRADPYAAMVWPASIAAARELASMECAGRTVVDVGAGTGLAALTAAALGATALALDHDPFARAIIAHAASAQRLSVGVRDFDVCSEAALPAADIIVVADLLYEPELARHAARRVSEALQAGATVLVSDPGRSGRTVFEEALAVDGILTTFRDVVIEVPGDPQPSRVGVATLRP